MLRAGSGRDHLHAVELGVLICRVPTERALNNGEDAAQPELRAWASGRCILSRLGSTVIHSDPLYSVERGVMAVMAVMA